MAKTLREGFENRNIKLLREKLSLVDANIIKEMKVDDRSKLIYEAFDKAQMTAAIDIVKKLKAIDFGGLNALAQARDTAVADVTSVLAGNKSTGIIRRIVDLFRDNKENPLVDALAFSDALKNFFEQFTQYVAALGNDLDDEATLGAIVSGKSTEDVEDLSSVNALETDAKKRLSELQGVIINGFKPNGALAALGKNWVDKYLKGKKGLKMLANDILKVRLKDLKIISANVTSSLKNVEAVGQAAAGAAQQASVGTTQTTGTAQAKASSATAGSKGTTSGAKAPGAQPAGAPAGDNVEKLAKAVYDDIRADFGDVDEQVAMNILKTLANNGKLKQ